LWKAVSRENLMVKVPATPAGIPAIEQLLSEGININVTLLFGLEAYADVAEAYIHGLERRAAEGLALDIHSVASFFVSRVDTEVDARLDKIGSPEAKSLRGTAAIANARLAYERYERVFSRDNPRWHALLSAGAQPQRPLWASTGVKDPSYDDTRYVVDLVAPGTVNTMPEATLDAVHNHGVVRGDSIRGNYAAAHEVLDSLADVGVDYDDVVTVLEREGVEKFETSWSELLTSLDGRLKGEKD
jgi:transaldolase